MPATYDKKTHDQAKENIQNAIKEFISGVSSIDTSSVVEALRTLETFQSPLNIQSRIDKINKLLVKELSARNLDKDSRKVNKLNRDQTLLNFEIIKTDRKALIARIDEFLSKTFQVDFLIPNNLAHIVLSDKKEELKNEFTSSDPVEEKFIKIIEVFNTINKNLDNNNHDKPEFEEHINNLKNFFSEDLVAMCGVHYILTNGYGIYYDYFLYCTSGDHTSPLVGSFKEYLNLRNLYQSYNSPGNVVIKTFENYLAWCDSYQTYNVSAENKIDGLAKYVDWYNLYRNYTNSDKTKIANLDDYVTWYNAHQTYNVSAKNKIDGLDNYVTLYNNYLAHNNSMGHNVVKVNSFEEYVKRYHNGDRNDDKKTNLQLNSIAAYIQSLNSLDSIKGMDGFDINNPQNNSNANYNPLTRQIIDHFSQQKPLSGVAE
jgi:hypothetical protein